MLCKALHGGLKSDIQKERASLHTRHSLMRFIHVQANISETGVPAQVRVESSEGEEYD